LLNRYISVFERKNESDEQLLKLERESKLVRKVKPLLHQRTFSIDKLSTLNISIIPKSEKDVWCAIIEREKAKIRTYLQ
jgi:hypothetical protein